MSKGNVLFWSMVSFLLYSLIILTVPYTNAISQGVDMTSDWNATHYINISVANMNSKLSGIQTNLGNAELNNTDTRGEQTELITDGAVSLVEKYLPQLAWVQRIGRFIVGSQIPAATLSNLLVDPFEGIFATVMGIALWSWQLLIVFAWIRFLFPTQTEGS